MTYIQNQKIQKKISFENLLILYIILQPILDIFTSLCVRNISSNFTFGIFIRTIFMLFIMIYTFIKIDKKNKWQLLIYYTLIIVYSIIFMLHSFSQYRLSMIFTQFKGLVKTLYFPIVLSSLLVLFKNKNYYSKIKYLNISLLLYILPIIICKLFAVGYPTYPLGNNLGTIGLFYAGNELSAILALLSPLCFALFIKSKFNILNALFCILTVFTMLEIGTKVTCISIIILLFITFVISLTTFIKSKNNYKHFISIVIIIILTILFIGNTSGGKNLGLPSILSYSTSLISPSQNSVNSNHQYIENPEILLSGRNEFFKNTLKKYESSSIICKIIGLGYINNEDSDTVVESKLIEIDYFDIFFCLGFLGTLIYIIPIILVLLISTKYFWRNYKNVIQDSTTYFIIYSILLICGIALMAGHVLTAPAVSFNLALMLNEAINIFKYKRGENEK